MIFDKHKLYTTAGYRTRYCHGRIKRSSPVFVLCIFKGFEENRMCHRDCMQPVKPKTLLSGLYRISLLTPDRQRFHHPSTPCGPSAGLTSPFPPTTDLLSITVVLPFLEFLINDIIQYGTFCVWLLSLITLLRFVIWVFVYQ